MSIASSAASSASSSSRSSLCFPPASSLSSAPSSWSSPLSHLDLPPPPCVVNMNPASLNVSSSSRAPGTTVTPSIAALPSLAHSLSAFPTMTVVTNDMVHYGTLCRTKGASEAKLNSALLITKQRQGAVASPGAKTMVSARRLRSLWRQHTAGRVSDPQAQVQVSAASSPLSAAAYVRYPTPDDDDPVLLFVPKRMKTKRSS